MKFATVTTIALFCALPAAAQDSTGPALSAMIADLEADGYRVTDVDVDRSSIDVEAVTQDQRQVELRLDPATGEILEETADD